MTVPLMRWEEQEPFRDDVIWWTRLDGRFQIEVVRTGERSAELRIFDHDHDNEHLLTEHFGLAYGAIFGPDVAAWQERAMKYVDTEMSPTE